MATIEKNSCFEYLLMGFKKWYEEYYEKHTDKPHAEFLKEFTRLKSLKLLFLVSSIPVNGCDLLDIFDKFYAMQYGPVESDIYTAMVNSEFQYFTFKDRTTKLEETVLSFEGLSDVTRMKLDSSLKALQNKNEDLIAYPASVLVSITHKWVSWRSAYMLALMLNKGSQLMETKFIRKDPKFFE